MKKGKKKAVYMMKYNMKNTKNIVKKKLGVGEKQ